MKPVRFPRAIFTVCSGAFVQTPSRSRVVHAMSDRCSFRPATNVADSCSGLQYRTTHMSTRRILWVAALLGAISAPVFAQTPQPSKPAAPAVTTPAKPANPTTPAPVVNKINLNTATELDTLPQIGPARAGHCRGPSQRQVQELGRFRCPQGRPVER